MLAKFLLAAALAFPALAVGLNADAAKCKCCGDKCVCKNCVCNEKGCACKSGGKCACEPGCHDKCCK